MYRYPVGSLAFASKSVVAAMREAGKGNDLSQHMSKSHACHDQVPGRHDGGSVGCPSRLTGESEGAVRSLSALLNWKKARQPASPPARQPASPPARQPASPPARQPASPPARQPASPPARQPASPPARQPASPPARQPASPPARQPASPPARQPASPASPPVIKWARRQASLLT